MHRLLLLSAFLFASFFGHAHAETRPNILFLFADDLTWEGVRKLGDLDIDTPHLDRLATEGTVFDRAYNAGAWHGAVCVASRTMLNTGLPLWEAKKAESRLNRDFVGKQQMWGQLMHKGGYHSQFAGKWHVKAKAENSFDAVRNVRPGMPRSVKSAYNRPLKDQPDPWNPADKSLGGFWKGGTHWSVVVAKDFEAFMDEKSGPAPWFTLLAFNAPHDPRQSPQRNLDAYPLERVAVPEDFLPLYPYAEQMGAGRKLRDERLAPFPRTKTAVKTHRREYFALITHLDEQIGRILKKLDASGQRDNTWIFFTADHGLACGHHGLMGKQNMYEHSMRVPFIVAGPGVPAGKHVSAPIYLQDAMPTALEIAGVEKPEHVAFQSILPHLKDKGTARKSIYGAYMNSQRMIIAQDHKLILYPKAEKALLFNLLTDPGEQKNLMDEKNPATLKMARTLFALFLKEQATQGDPLDLRPVFPDLVQ